MDDKKYYMYILTNRSNTVLYVGFTGDLEKRLYEHEHHLVEGFTDKYNVYKLVYYEQCDEALPAIEREKQVKRWSRKKKIQLIERMNPEWNDLAKAYMLR